MSTPKLSYYRAPISSPDDHACPLCTVVIDLDLDDIIEAESEIPESTRQGLVYIAGCVSRKLFDLSNQLEEEDTTDEYSKHGQMISEQNRGGLSIPRDRLVFFTYYCYIAFALQQQLNMTCQKNYIEYFTQINDFTDLLPRDTKKICRILTNTFLNNWCKKQNEEKRSKNNDMIKRAKLSV